MNQVNLMKQEIEKKIKEKEMIIDLMELKKIKEILLRG